YLAFAITDDGLTHQTELAPAADRLGRDVEFLAYLLQGNDRFRDLLTPHGRKDLTRKGLHQEQQVMRQILAGDKQIRMGFGAVFGDAPAHIVIRIPLRGIDFGKESLGPHQLLGPARRRGETHLLIRQLLQSWLLKACHNHTLLSASRPNPSRTLSPYRR